jgi:hypothetical protein
MWAAKSALIATSMSQKVWAQVPHSQWMLDEKLPEHLRGCEACHGPGSLHVVQRPGNIVAWSKLSIAEQNAICLAMS